MGLRDRRSPRLTEPVTANRQFGFRVYQGDLARTLVAPSLSLFPGSASAFGRAACMPQRLS